MKRFFVLFSISVLAISCLACSVKQDSLPSWPWEDPDKDDEPWTEVSSEYGGLPEYVKIFKSPEKLQGTKALAYIATVDMSKAGFNVWGLDDPEIDGTEESLKTPAVVYKDNNAAIIINGGYFYSDGGKNYPASLAVNEGKLLSYNINYCSDDWVKIYYPTRAAFIQHTDGTIEASWTYYTSSGKHFVYDQPARNSMEGTPLAVPSETFPSEARIFEAKNAIGGGPVLIKNGELKNTFLYECFKAEKDVQCAVPAPRTAIGVTKDNLLVLFVCEGRGMTEGVKGLTTEQVGKALLQFGCIDAINLDGGGSSCMLVGGKETIKPSDGTQRHVGSCIYIK